MRWHPRQARRTALWFRLRPERLKARSDKCNEIRCARALVDAVDTTTRRARETTLVAARNRRSHWRCAHYSACGSDSNDVPPNVVREEPVRQASSLGQAAESTSQARRRHHSRAGRRVSPQTAHRGHGRPRVPDRVDRRGREPCRRSRRHRDGNCPASRRPGPALLPGGDENLPAAVAMHIHKGATGVAGPVVVPLQTPNAAGSSSGCAPAARTLVAAILATPARTT